MNKSQMARCVHYRVRLRPAVYAGDTEQDRDVRERLKSHLKDRYKVRLVDETSDVCIHFMITEFLVLSTFDDLVGALPALNKRKSQKHV